MREWNSAGRLDVHRRQGAVEPVSNGQVGVAEEGKVEGLDLADAGIED